MYKVAIRTDGGFGIGMGHVMRCLSLAKELKKTGKNVIFICREAAGIEKIRKENFEVLALGGEEDRKKNYNGYEDGALQKESEQIIKILDEKRIGLLIVDKYNLSEDYFLKLKNHVKKIVYIDDLNQFVYPVDLVINGNLYGPSMNYEKYTEEQEFLLGPAFNLMREEFRNLPKKQIGEKADRIMITTGGSDPHHMTQRFLKMMLRDKTLEALTIHVILGNLFTTAEELKKMAKQHKAIVFHENVSHISEIMGQVDIGISAGGTTLYELAASGTPTLAFILADNQEQVVKEMEEEGYLISLGWFYQIDEKIFLSKLKELMKDYRLRKTMSSKGSGLVDGRGVERVVKHMDKMMGIGIQ
ncbi:MAG: UDP-2,4-diacetamido-2,4,6-trideoxy-beta-L-altropyranose hydrolase [Thermotaleaceae bacterium]